MNLPAFSGRKDAAGHKKLAAFFLLNFILLSSLFCEAIPFVLGGKIYSFNDDYSVDQMLEPAGFTSRGVCKSEKNGFILAWNQKSELLCHIDPNRKISSRFSLKASAVYMNKEYILTQSNNFDENKGFALTLYKIKYSVFSPKLKLKNIWHGYVDCFVSDCFFMDDGICIAGGTRDNLKHGVYAITAKGIHKCFSMPKKSDFLRIIPASKDKNQIIAFVSSRDKSEAMPAIYEFNVDNTKGSESAETICLDELEGFPKSFDCFFGYGFKYEDEVIIPASLKGNISFIKYNPENRLITGIASDAIGCNFPLGNMKNGFCYIARDPLLEDSYYGLALYDGKEIIKVCDFRQ